MAGENIFENEGLGEVKNPIIEGILVNVAEVYATSNQQPFPYVVDPKARNLVDDLHSHRKLPSLSCIAAILVDEEPTKFFPLEKDTIATGPSSLSTGAPPSTTGLLLELLEHRGSCSHSHLRFKPSSNLRNLANKPLVGAKTSEHQEVDAAIAFHSSNMVLAIPIAACYIKKKAVVGREASLVVDNSIVAMEDDRVAILNDNIGRDTIERDHCMQLPLRFNSNDSDISDSNLKFGCAKGRYVDNSDKIPIV
ncbi:hypothetical protein ACH5RR_036751 [Cinchona calisaya]|uniref:Uncharacterized protein n=1 Tax=Cinchona calisaya TaxID=153742 RepID=A0ABD2Y436_9GENT